MEDLKNKTELMIQLNYNCMLHCIHCAYGDIQDSTQITLDKVKIFLKENQPELIKISGGEPTLNLQWNEIITECKNTGAKVISFTNGIIKRETDPDFYWVSLYGNKNIHNFITSSLAFDITLDFIKKYRVEYLNSPIFNKEQIKSLVEISESFNIPLRITQLLPHGREHKVLSLLEQRQIIKDLKLNNGWNWITCSLGFEEPRCNKKVCLKPDGSKTICTYLIRGLECPFKRGI